MARTLDKPVVGQPAPGFSLPDASGERWNLSDHLGHPVVLIFHRHIH